MTAHGPDPALDRLILAERISDWLDALDLGDDPARTALATALAGILASAAEARRLLETALATHPLTDPAEADRALEAMTELTVHLAGDLRAGLDDLEQAWPALEDRLIELGPDEADA